MGEEQLAAQRDYVTAHLKLLFFAARKAWLCDKAIFDSEKIAAGGLPACFRHDVAVGADSILVYRSDMVTADELRLIRSGGCRGEQVLGQVLGYLQPMKQSSTDGDARVTWTLASETSSSSGICLWSEFFSFNMTNLQRVFERYNNLCTLFAPLLVQCNIVRWTSIDPREQCACELCAQRCGCATCCSRTPKK